MTKWNVDRPPRRGKPSRCHRLPKRFLWWRWPDGTEIWCGKCGDTYWLQRSDWDLGREWTRHPASPRPVEDTQERPA